MHALVTASACFCIIKNINMDSIIGYFSTASSTFIAYIFPFGFFLKTFQRTNTRAGTLYRAMIQFLYYGFWIFQLFSIASLFYPA